MLKLPLIERMDLQPNIKTMKLTKNVLAITIWTTILIIAIMSATKLEDLLVIELSKAAIIISLLNFIRLLTPNNPKPVLSRQKEIKAE